jgi:hypothetical protein
MGNKYLFSQKLLQKGKKKIFLWYNLDIFYTKIKNISRKVAFPEIIISHTPYYHISPRADLSGQSGNEDIT